MDIVTLARNFFFYDRMIARRKHIEPLRKCAENAMNCWLTYVLSQPVKFDIFALTAFLLHYVGHDRLAE